ncbi:5-oxoprolinase subunit B family protein [Dietzia sp. PP-33]|uniref:5-oxoprolinase subunit B family protein n=1 Tax=Dietzia sp. PP-33 TaxID=2957500 RepID=UPI0029B1EFF7|nr:carboxyltransferase domain-containing protein [Dietzia sp. PP-33]MDX2356203.1 allophanate hydrolase subunit 1 [Dietzia sp. PP-33]
MTTTRIRSCGEAALIVDCADLAEAVELAAGLEQLRPDAVDVVAAARTVLVTARGASALPELRRSVEELLDRDPLHRDLLRQGPPPAGGGGGAAEPGVQAPEVILDVRYDGPDLATVAELVGISTEALVRRHTSITWRAAFGGFAPGFFYLVDQRELAGRESGGRESGGRELAEPLPPVPRLESPRPRVPAGSVGLADRFCAVYPGSSPGGWRLLGTTDALLWDVDRPDPALLAPGMTVRFREVPR